MVTDYIARALERARYELLPDGTFAATVRGLRGVVATEATLEHEFMVKGNLVLTIPNPHKGDIGPDLMATVLRQAGITRQQWERA
jgi:hypothetical protein